MQRKMMKRNGKIIDITIVNRLVKEKPYLNIYHNDTSTSHMISYKRSVTLPFNTHTKKDFIDLSVVSEPGLLLGSSKVSLPLWLDFEFLTGNPISVHCQSTGEAIIIDIPDGFLDWHLKLTLKHDSLPCRKRELAENCTHYIIVSGDDNVNNI